MNAYAPPNLSIARHLICSAALFCAAPAAAQVTSNISATDTLIVEARTDNGNGTVGDDHYAIAINRLNVNGNAGDFSSQLRVDAFYVRSFCDVDTWAYAPNDRNDDGFADPFDYATFDDTGAFVDARDDGVRDGVDFTGDGIPDASDINLDGAADPFPRRCAPIAHRSARSNGLQRPDHLDWQYRNDVVLERMQLAYRRGDWSLTVGDNFRQLGRGIVLSIRKVDEAGLDVALRGGTVEFRGDDHRIAVFAGRANPANIDAINQQYVAPIDDIIAGYDYQLRAIEGVRINLFAAYLEVGDRVNEDASDRDYTFSQGVSIGLPQVTPGLSLYAEGDLQARDVGGVRAMGLASYVSADIAHRDFSVLIEGIAMDDFRQNGSGNTALSGARFTYNQAPTLERIDQETLNSPTVLGGRVRVEQYFFDADTTIYGSGNLLLNHRGAPGELRQMHGFAGVETRYNSGASRFEISGGYRDETQTNLPAQETPFATFERGHNQIKSTRHIEFDWVHGLGNGLSLHVSSTNEFRELENDPRQRGSAFLGLDRAGLGALTFEFGYNNEVQGPDIRHLFFAGIAKWEATDWLTMTATAGTQRGGIKCINGVCREYPAFSGARFEFIGRF